jgi:hypothetical protein
MMRDSEPSIVTSTGFVDLRRPRLSTASTRSLWLPAGSSAGSTSRAYGSVVSDPTGRSSRKNVTATTRLRGAPAFASSNEGFVSRCGPRKRTEGELGAGGAAGGDDDGESVHPVTALSSAANRMRVRFPRSNVSSKR